MFPKINSRPHHGACDTSGSSPPQSPEEVAGGPNQSPWYALTHDAYQQIHARCSLSESVNLGEVDRTQSRIVNDSIKPKLLSGLKRIALGPKQGEPWTMDTIPQVLHWMRFFRGELNNDEVAILKSGLQSDHLAAKEVDVAHLIRNLKVSKKLKAALATTTVRALWEPACWEILSELGLDPDYVNALPRMREAVLKAPSCAEARDQFRDLHNQPLCGPRTIGSTPAHWVDIQDLEVGFYKGQSSLALRDGRLFLGSTDRFRGLILGEDSSGRWRIEHDLVHNYRVSSAAQLSDGRLVTVGCEGHTPQVWSRGDDQWAYVLLEGHTEGVPSVAVSPAGHIVTGSRDKTVRVWSENNGVWVGDILPTDHCVSTVAVLADGKIVALSDNELQTYVWSKCGRDWSRATLPGSLLIRALPQGGFLAGGRDGLRIWNELKGQWHGEIISAEPCYSGHQGSWFLTSAFMLPEGQVASMVKGRGYGGKAMVWKKSGDQSDNWAPAVLQLQRKLNCGQRHQCLTPLPDGRLIVSSEESFEKHDIWSQIDGQWHFEQGLPGNWTWLESVTALPDGRFMALESGYDHPVFHRFCNLRIYSPPRSV